MKPLRSYSLFPLGVLAFLAALTFWLEATSRSGTTPSDSKTRHDPDYVIHHFTATKLGPQGQLQHLLKAEELRHYPDNDTTDVVEPKLTYLGGELPLHLSARYARLGPEGKTALLQKHVFGSREASPKTPEMTFSTERLMALPDDEIAATDEFVTLTHGKSKTTAIGMDVDNKARIVNLHSHVKNFIEPRKH